MTRNPFLAFQKQIQLAVEKLNLPTFVKERLKWPKRVIEVRFPIRLESGKELFLTGWRVQHNDILGPTKGGIRYHWDVSKDSVMALAGLMMLKNATMELPYGGAHGGIRFRDMNGEPINPRDLSDRDIEKISRSFVDAIFPLIGTDRDIWGIDLYTSPQVIGYMVDEFSKLTGEWVPSAFTGKPVSIGGTICRDTATARGGFFVLREALSEMAGKFEDITAAIQGFGRVGAAEALFLYKAGAKVVSVSDTKGGVYSEKGLNVPELMEFKKERGTVVGFPGTEEISNEDLLKLDVDVLVLAAVENQITVDNARDIRTKFILELASGPITPEADKILYEENDVMVLPDILSSGGGSVVSYFEWIQGRTGYYWNEEEIDKRLSEKMKTVFRDVIDTARDFHVSIRMGAYIKAIQRIVSAMRDRGLI